MAILNPKPENIDRFRVRPTEGEQALIKFLTDNLDDSYEVFFQPQLNGDNPDIIVLRRHSGALIIEVKDWELKNYSIENNGNWKLRQNNARIKSPFSQVFSYKENLYNLHIKDLLEKQIKSPKLFSLVSCAVYFHAESNENVQKFLKPTMGNPKYKKFFSYFEILGKDSLTPPVLQSFLKRHKLDKDNRYFGDDLYKSFKRYLQPTLHQIEDGIPIEYTPNQRRLIVSKPGQQKIKGVAGSGKTMILAKRAVEANKRTKSKILILTYNITLRNYIHDKINEIREKFDWNNFEILNYHEFFKAKANNYGLRFNPPPSDPSAESDFEDESFFEPVREQIEKYPAIFIDEVQDYKPQWLRLIKKYFLAPNGEYVVYGDEKQNIYERTIETDKRPYTGIPGNWNILNESFRLTTEIAQVAIDFQKMFFPTKYDIDNIDSIQLGFTFEQKERIRYIYIERHLGVQTVYSELFSFLKSLNIHPNDASILSPNVHILRDIDFLVRHIAREKTMTMFETKEMYWYLLVKSADGKIVNTQKLKQLFKLNRRDLILSLCWLDFNTPEGQSKAAEYLKSHNSNFESFQDYYFQLKQFSENGNSKLFEDLIDKIRRNKKFNFWMNPGTMKLSTIHSFKGWEIQSLFLLLDEADDTDFVTDELIYTGITRCRRDLIVINLGNKRYDDFFRSKANGDGT